MTQEEKQLLFKDLCSRLPHGVKVRISSESDVCLYVYTTTLDIDNLHKYVLDGGYYERGLFYKTPGFQLLPYLRPMSSMTEEEKEEYTSYCFEQPFLQKDKTPNLGSVPMCIDWLLAHHFDFLGLIPIGLALEAPVDMYKN